MEPSVEVRTRDRIQGNQVRRNSILGVVSATREIKPGGDRLLSSEGRHVDASAVA